MFDKVKKSFTCDGGFNEIFLVAYPLIILSASHSVMQFCDRKFLALNSSEDVAAALPAGILSFTLFSFFMVTVNFTSALVSQYFGRRDRKACVRAAWNGFYLAIGAAVVILFVTPWIGLYAIELGAHGAEIVKREKEYFLTLLPGGAFVCMGAAFFAYFSGQGKTWYAAVINTIACGINIALDYVMIFGKFGFPAMGIAGAGLATSISMFISFLIIFTVFIFQKQWKHPTRKYRNFSFPDIKKLFEFGTPSGLQCFLEVGAFTFFAFLMGALGIEALAAATIVLSINNLSFLPLLGMMDATGIKAGQYIGRNDMVTAEKIAYRAWIMSIAYMVCACSVYVLLPSWLMNNFAPKGNMGDADFKKIFELGRHLLFCAAVFNFFDATKFIFMGALRGAGDTKAILFIGAGLNWFILVPGVIIMIKFLHASVLAIWIYMTVYILIEAAVFFWRFKSGRWKKIDMIGHRNPTAIEAQPLNENMPPV
ncbi:MAG: hypothetical protein A2017_18680 [Lentisphaerae bacterium GWF2_44_16]|nr:MAG: hypothetical protein A2017_18680 [Lentisphaerae bacterium GWF2_44_16]